MYEFESQNPVIITQYKWAGKWGLFRIKSHCQECDLVTSTLRSMVGQEFKGKNVVFEVKPWLDNIFFCLRQGAWHAPIIMINGKKFFQFSEKKPLFERAQLIKAVEEILSEQARLKNQPKESGV
jgi:hypothetical protein